MSITDETGRRVALVTGASSGIGRATALAFAEAGYRVALADHDRPGLEATREQIVGKGGIAASFEVDVSEEASVIAMVEGVIATFGRLDAAHNNAGIGGPRDKVHELSVEDWDRVNDVNLRGVFLCMKYQIPHLLLQEGAAIVNTASELGVVANPAMSSYVASKHGVIGLTKGAALDYGGKIRINAVCPGVVQTPIIEGLNYDVEAVSATYPVGRIGQPEEIASAVVWLCSPGASFTTGAAFVIDGGHSIT